MEHEKIRNIIIHDGFLCENSSCAGAVPLNWSWEIPENTDMPPKAFLLYVENPDFVEMRQIYVARRCIRQGLGSRILKMYEDKQKAK